MTQIVSNLRSIAGCRILSVLALMTLAGCVSLPDRMVLDWAIAKPQRLVVIDARDTDAKVSRVKVDTLGQWIYLGDDYFSPPPVEILSTFLDERMPARFAGQPVTIKEIETFVTVFEFKPTPLQVPLNSPSAVLGAAIGQALSDAIQRRHTFATLVTIAIDGKEYSAGSSARLSASDVPSQVRDVLHTAYHKLLEKLSNVALPNQSIQPTAEGGG